MQRGQWKKGLVWLTAGLLALFLMGTANAADDGVFDLGEVVVKEKGETVTAVTTVDEISAEDMAKNNTESVDEALNTLPGVFNTIGQRNEAYINVRGFNQRYIPVFLDGIPMYIPYDGYVDTSNLSTSSLSKITLSKGVSSVLYGPNTLGGVVNMVSRAPEKPFEAGISMEFQEPGTSIMNTNLGLRGEKLYFILNGGYAKSEGFVLPDSFESTAEEDGEIRDNSDYEDKNISTKIGLTPAGGHEYAIGWHHVESEKGWPVTTDPDGWIMYRRFANWDKDTFYLLGDSKITPKLSTKLRLYHDGYYNVLDNYSDNTYSNIRWHSTYDDYSYGGSLTVRTQYIPKNTLSMALHYKKDVHAEQGNYSEPWDKYEQTTMSAGIEDDFKITNKVALVAGVAYDINSADYANGGDLRDDITVFSPQAGILWTAGEDWDWHASIGKKTRFPTLSELYSEQMGGNEPNPDLEEEQATNIEIGLTKPLNENTLMNIAVFYSDISNKIAEKFHHQVWNESRERWDDVMQYQNIDKARHVGFEVGLSTKWGNNNETGISYTLLDATNQSDSKTSDHIEEESMHKLFITNLINLNQWFAFFMKAEYNSERYQEVDDGVWDTVDPFFVVDAKLIYSTPLDGMTIEGGFMNIFDENYETSIGFPRPGRTFFCKLSYQY